MSSVTTGSSIRSVSQSFCASGVRVAQTARASALTDHALSHTVAAWERAIHAARDQRARVVLRAPGWARQWFDIAGDALHSAARHMRLCNRARLAKRARR